MSEKLGPDLLRAIGLAMVAGTPSRLDVSDGKNKVFIDIYRDRATMDKFHKMLLEQEEEKKWRKERNIESEPSSGSLKPKETPQEQATEKLSPLSLEATDTATELVPDPSQSPK